MRVLGIGNPLMDLLVHVDNAFLKHVPGEKGGSALVEPELIQQVLSQVKTEVLHQCGGGAANTIYGLARLGTPVTFIGTVGHDPMGETFVHQFKDAEICADRLRYHEVKPTGHCLSLITPDTQRTMRTYLGASIELNCDDISLSDFNGCTHVHTEAYLFAHPGLTEKILSLAKEAGCTTSLGLASFEVVANNRELVEHLLTNYVDVVFASEDEAEIYVASGDLDEGLKALAEHCPVAAVTLGKNGALIQSKSEKIHVPTAKAEALDVTGAGDLWAAGFLYGYLNKWPLKKSAEMGCLLGTSCVTQHGARLAEVFWKDIQERLHSV